MESLERPGGNLTGLDLRRIELMGKRLELLKEALPTTTRLAVLVDPANPIYQEVPHHIAREGEVLSVQLQRVEARGAEDFEGAFAAMVQGGGRRADATGGSPFGVHMPRLLALAQRYRLPTMCSGRQDAMAGCLLTYGGDSFDLCQRSAVLVDKILKGAKPADLPVERADKFNLIVNLRPLQSLA